MELGIQKKYILDDSQLIHTASRLPKLYFKKKRI